MTYRCNIHREATVPEAARGDLPLVVMRWALPFLLLATLAVAMVGCAKHEDYPAGSYCLLTDEYLEKLFVKDRVPTDDDQPAMNQETI